jgi:hypothetical protein
MPAIEPTRFRVQLYNHDAGKLVQGISSKQRSHFIEMAVIAWLKTPGGKAAAEALLLRGANPDRTKALIEAVAGQEGQEKPSQIKTPSKNNQQPAKAAKKEEPAEAVAPDEEVVEVGGETFETMMGGL